LTRHNPFARLAIGLSDAWVTGGKRAFWTAPRLVRALVESRVARADKKENAA
jgi:hypothetical protein